MKSDPSIPELAFGLYSMLEATMNPQTRIATLRKTARLRVIGMIRRVLPAYIGEFVIFVLR